MHQIHISAIKQYLTKSSPGHPQHIKEPLVTRHMAMATTLAKSLNLEAEEALCTSNAAILWRAIAKPLDIPLGLAMAIGHVAVTYPLQVGAFLDDPTTVLGRQSAQIITFWAQMDALTCEDWGRILNLAIERRMAEPSALFAASRDLQKLAAPHFRNEQSEDIFSITLIACETLLSNAPHAVKSDDLLGTARRALPRLSACTALELYSLPKLQHSNRAAQFLPLFQIDPAKISRESSTSRAIPAKAA